MEEYQFIIEMYSTTINNKKYEKDFVKVKDSFNNDTSCGKITDFVVLPHGFILTYKVNAKLKCPNAALGRLSRYWIENIPAAKSAVIDGRLCHEVDEIPLGY